VGQMVKMGLQEVLDRPIPRHGNQRGLSWGWTAVIWLGYILTEGDHRKVSVEGYIQGMKEGMVQKCPILGNTSNREPTLTSRGENWLVKREA
jgi:transposase